MPAAPRRRRGALRRPWRAAPTRAAGGQGGRGHERGLRAGGQDRRGIWRRPAAAAAWCSSTPGASGSDPRRWWSRRAMSRAWPSGRRARSPRDIERPAAAAWCSSTPGASGSDPRRWRSRRAMSQSVAFGPGGPDRRGISRRPRRRRRGALRRPGRAAPTRAAGGQGGHVTSVAFGPEGKIAAGYGVGVGGSGVVLFDARGERLRPAPLVVKEGYVT